MNRLRALLCRFRGLFRRRTLEAELSEELRAHLDELIERNVATGLSPEEARYAARCYSRPLCAIPLMLSLVVFLLLGVSAVASLFPAWRATKVDPMVALRTE